MITFVSRTSAGLAPQFHPCQHTGCDRITDRPGTVCCPPCATASYQDSLPEAGHTDLCRTVQARRRRVFQPQFVAPPELELLPAAG